MKDLAESRNVVRWLPLLASGFSSENSSRRMTELIAFSTRDVQLRQERTRSLVYPILVALITVFVFALLCLLVVPIFDEMFSEFELQLPLPTWAVIEFSRQVNTNPLRTLSAVLGVAVGVCGGLRLWTYFAMTTRCLGGLVSGNSSSLQAISGLSGHLAELLQVGVSLPDAIWIAGQSCDNHYFKKSAERLAQDARSNKVALSQSRFAKIFPSNLIHALDVNEGKPNIGLLRALSAMYTQRLQRRVSWAAGVVAPMMIIFLGAAIAFIVLALFMPLVSLISGLT